MNILYCGDSPEAAVYINESLRYLGHEADHVGFDQDFPGLQQQDVLILSDYPASKLDSAHSAEIISRVEQGMRLLMVGGWESFNGFGRGYYRHPIARILPVGIKSEDDRVNYHQGLVLEKVASGFADILPWDEPPIICGYNDATTKPESEVLAIARPLIIREDTVALGAAVNLITRLQVGKGTTIACLTDLAPHWSGGLVDWGNKRIKLSEDLEVSDAYIGFLNALLR